MPAPVETRPDASPSVVATKKPPSSLLPAFEPFSSPALPRPLKRTRETYEEQAKYPTPVPTSSTHILTSSPSRGNVETSSAAKIISSERAPLASLPSIDLNPGGRPVRLGRASASCDYQLSANRLISRVHVVATYKPTINSLDRERIDILVTGWNGVKVHCQSKIFEVRKGETFTTDVRGQEIMLDVHGTRVMVNWPEKAHLGPASSDEEEDLPSPSKKQRALLRHSTPPSPSPVQTRRKPISPISPTPALVTHLPSSPPVISARHEIRAVEIYEDPVHEPGEEDVSQSHPTQPTQIMSQNLASFKSLHSFQADDEFADDNDEENDPLVHSFGPFGSNLQARLASITTTGTPLAASVKSPPPINSPPAQSPARSKDGDTATDFDIKSHVINQLAYSRLSSTPLSTILGNLPSEAGTLRKSVLQSIMADTECIGEVTREGKDAHGKPLESEYYYLPENDDDELRREAVVNDLRKPGLRACRKQHKQYFWRKPK